MSWRLRNRFKRLLSYEKGTICKRHTVDLRVALVYPNTYFVGMSNLGFQVIYRLLNERKDTLCERTFLPEPEDMAEFIRTKTPLFTLESFTPLREFDIIAISICFELDCLNILKIFELSRIPIRGKERDDTYPLVVAGGVMTWTNPEPIVDFIDVFVLGEGEEVIQEVLDIYKEERGSKKGLLQNLSKIEGVYVPTISCNFPIKRRLIRSLDNYPVVSSIISPNTEFSNMFLIEVTRGCSFGCRFCLTGFVYRPFRYKVIDCIMDQVKEALRYTRRIGLVGGAVSIYPKIVDLCSKIRSAGGEVSLSSLRITSVTSDLLKNLHQKTITIAIDGSSFRLRQILNKQIEDKEILERLVLISDTKSSITDIKLYLMIGLPEEKMEDIEALVRLIKKIELKKRLILSINPFIPKPHTPFQWIGMERKRVLHERLNYLRGNLPKVHIVSSSLNRSFIQACLARGDRRLGDVLYLVHTKGVSFSQAFKELQVDPLFYAYRRFDYSEYLPWDYIDTGVKKGVLIEEAKKAQYSYV
ncbi:MAG: radical SAM protein [bacterium]|nr:radical SAM protein [bacterium]